MQGSSHKICLMLEVRNSKILGLHVMLCNSQKVLGSCCLKTAKDAKINLMAQAHFVMFKCCVMKTAR